MLERSLHKRRLGLVAMFVLITSSALALDQSKAGCGMPVALDDGWAIASAESVGMDGARLCDIESRVKLRNSSLHAVVIARHGKLVFEQYFAGIDQPWDRPAGPYDFDAMAKHDMRSVSKSITSLLVGIAIDRRLIKSVNEPVMTFFSELSGLKTEGLDKITLRHLLTMTSGLQWDEALPWTHPDNDEPHLGYEADPIRYILSKPIAAPPDAMWVYNGGGTDLLGNIIERTSGRALEAFARESLFGPLDITDFEWKAYPRNGKIAAAAGLRLRPRDAAKIGQLLLSDGAWNGRQVVPPDWIMQSVIPRFQAVGYFGGTLFYGYQWWMGRSLSNGKEVTWIAALGWGGQRIFVIPDLALVVMMTAAQYGAPKEGVAALDLLANLIIPAVTDPH